MEFKRLVEVGRVIIVNYGQLVGNFAVIVDILTPTKVIVQELKVKGDIKRQELSLTNVTLTEDKVDIEKGAKKEEVLKAIEEYKIENKYKKSNFGKKVEIRQKRANLTDFDRFKDMSYKIKTK